VWCRPPWRSRLLSDSRVDMLWDVLGRLITPPRYRRPWDENDVAGACDLAAILFSGIGSSAHTEEARWGGHTLSQWIEMTNDPARFKRHYAVKSLGCFGAAARPALPVLRKLLDDKDVTVRDAAIGSLDRVASSDWKSPGRFQ